MIDSITAGLTRKQCNNLYDEVAALAQPRDIQRVLCQHDLFFLLSRVCRRMDINRDWLFERCREVEANPNGYLDLWAREHYKSTIITFGLTIQDIIRDPELCIAIFSLNRPIAKKFMSQIKQELTENVVLKGLFPSVLWANPEKEAPTWSLDDGLIVKRQGNPKEPTLSAWGLIEGMPTSAHYNIRIYDDIIDERHVGNPEMIAKATKAWELSLNLGSANPTKYHGANVERYVGTRYHFNDPYREIKKREAAIERKYPGTIDGKPDGYPVLWTREFMDAKRKKMGSYVFSCQILQDPVADEAQNFKEDWLSFWGGVNHQGMNKYLLCDPAGEKKKDNDYTVMLVIGLGPDQNYYLIDGIRDRLNLTERTSRLMAFHRKYRPKATGYEKYGKDSDIEHIEDTQKLEEYRFTITPLGGPMPKNDRIRKLIPLFENHRFFLPPRLIFTDYQGKEQDLVKLFIDEEFSMFPFAQHDDILDDMARIVDQDLKAVFPDSGTLTEAAVKDLWLKNAPPSVRSAYGR